MRIETRGAWFIDEFILMCELFAWQDDLDTLVTKVRGRERERETDRQADRQTDRKTLGYGERHKYSIYFCKVVSVGEKVRGIHYRHAMWSVVLFLPSVYLKQRDLRI